MLVKNEKKAMMKEGAARAEDTRKNKYFLHIVEAGRRRMPNFQIHPGRGRIW
jgi:hypothetical protein